MVRQDLPDGGCMTFAYDDARHQTTMTERNGRKTIYVQDEKYRNTDILYEDGTTEHFEYNEKNQKIKAIDRNGNSRSMAYDHRGNLTQIIYQSGMKINYTYDCNNKLLCLKVNGKENCIIPMMRKEICLQQKVRMVHPAKFYMTKRGELFRKKRQKQA